MERKNKLNYNALQRKITVTGIITDSKVNRKGSVRDYAHFLREVPKLLCQKMRFIP